MSHFSSQPVRTYQAVQPFTLEQLTFNTDGVCYLILAKHLLLPEINSVNLCNRFLRMKVPINTIDVTKTQRTLFTNH